MINDAPVFSYPCKTLALRLIITITSMNNLALEFLQLETHVQLCFNVLQLKRTFKKIYNNNIHGSDGGNCLNIANDKFSF